MLWYLTYYDACANIKTVMKNTNNNSSKKNNPTANRKVEESSERVMNNDQVNDLMNDSDVVAMVKQYHREDSQRKIALIISLMINLTFLVTAYTILCYDTTGRLFGRILGLNL